MKEKMYGPGEVIYYQNETDCKIYFLVKGKAELYIKNNNYKELHLTKLNVFNTYFHYF